jgi:hypothetical protein
MTHRIILLGVVMATAVAAADALPRFASRTGEKCQSCHVNPTGGGMRQAFGAQYGRETLPVPTWSDEYEIEDFSATLTNFVGVGADLRTVFLYEQRPGASSRNAFWQMQGDLYLNLRVAKKISIYLDKGLYSGFEAFGLANILPANGHIKVGKFVPGYGLRTDDHRLFIRRETGFSPEEGRPERTGLEAGVAPGAFSILGGVYNSEDGFGFGPGNQKAVLGRVDGLFSLDEELTLGLGVNVYSAKSSSGEQHTFWGGMGMFSFGDLTLTGEADLMKRDSGGVTVDGLVTFLEAAYVVIPGLDAKAGYEFLDPDIDVKNGSTSRINLGVEFFPLPGVELRPVYRFVLDDPDEVDNDEFQFIMHLYL